MAFSANLKNRLGAALASRGAATEFTNIYNVSTAGTVEASKAVVADSSKDVNGIRNLHLGTSGSTVGTLVIDGNTSGSVTVTVAAAAGTWTLTLPADDGDAGEQLQTNGSGVTTWEAAGSSRAVKEVLEDLSAKASDALDRIKERAVYAFHYIPNARQVAGLPALSDTKTTFHGVMADEYPEVMMYDGKIFSPISAFGEAMLAIKALAGEIEQLKARLA